MNFTYLHTSFIHHNLFILHVKQTMVGPVLLAINPFKDVSVAGSDVIMAYKEKILESPHAYKIADAAYTHMMRGEFYRYLSIIIK